MKITIRPISVASGIIFKPIGPALLYMISLLAIMIRIVRFGHTIPKIIAWISISAVKVITIGKILAKISSVAPTR